MSSPNGNAPVPDPAEGETQRLAPVTALAAARPTLDGSLAELRRRRYELAERAAELQQADAQLAEVQRLLSGAEGGVHGQCRSCGAVHSRGASFCWHCGAALIEEARPSVLPDEQTAGEQPT
jgi:hypothetical protein